LHQLNIYSGTNMVQVDGTSHYNFGTYLDLARWNSYYHQIAETLALKPKSVLIVGVGDNVVTTILKQQGIEVTTFDFDEILHPDILGNVIEIQQVVKNIKGEDRFDVLLCCQVLEHLPYENFENILQQFRTISDKVIISLPYSAMNFCLDIKLPHVRRRRINVDVHQFYKQFKYQEGEQHHWEVGFKGFSKRKIVQSINKFFAVKKQFLATYNHYHLFFLLQKL